MSVSVRHKKLEKSEIVKQRYISLVRCPLFHMLATVTFALMMQCVVVKTAPAKSPLHRQLLEIALNNIQKTLCKPPDQPCAPATAKERATPPISDQQAQTIVASGIISALGKHCGLDWQRFNFQPLMSYHREKLQMTSRQIALVGLLHGITMGAVRKDVERSACTSDLKSKTKKKFILK